MLSFSKDQAIFLPKAPRLALLDKLDDGLGKRIMLEPISDAVSEVALRVAYYGQVLPCDSKHWPPSWHGSAYIPRHSQTQLENLVTRLAWE